MSTTRIGKIGRLPRQVREELNRRLLEGEPGITLVDWLNGLPAVQAAQIFFCKIVEHVKLRAGLVFPC